MSYTKYDLHCHSTFSDGTFTPQVVVEKAHQAGIEFLALTDHDTTKGITIARAAAEPLGMRIISGVEISCEHELSGGYGKNKEIDKIIHILGLGFDDMEKMDATLSSLQESRAKRGRAMVAKLAQILSLDNEGENSLWQEILVKADNEPQAVGRAHIARVLLERGVVKTMQQSFNLYLGDNKPAYVKIDALTLQEGIELIHACGGQAVLAHPTGYRFSATRVRKLIAEFAAMGGDACELPQQREPISTRRMVDRVIAENDLLVSVGSDFHGSTMPWRKLGDVPRPTSEQVGVWEKFA